MHLIPKLGTSFSLWKQEKRAHFGTPIFGSRVHHHGFFFFFFFFFFRFSFFLLLLFSTYLIEGFHLQRLHKSLELFLLHHFRKSLRLFLLHRLHKSLGLFLLLLLIFLIKRVGFFARVSDSSSRSFSCSQAFIKINSVASIITCQWIQRRG